MTTFPNVTIGPIVVRGWLGLGGRTLSCHVCGTRIGDHREAHRDSPPPDVIAAGVPETETIDFPCTTSLRSVFVPHGTPVDGLAAYRISGRAMTRRPVRLRFDGELRDMLADTPAPMRYYADRGPGTPVHPPVHVWCLVCDAPQRIPVICPSCAGWHNAVT